MEIGETLVVTHRKDWRTWLAKHHKDKPEIWLVFHKKTSGKPSLPYDHAVEEALCYGWIDSIVKKVDETSRAQRFTPRRPNSPLSELNKERVRLLIKAKKMTQAGLAVIPDDLDAPFVIADDIVKALKADKTAWHNFQKFPPSYKRIRIGFIEMARSRPDFFKQRLDYFVTMCAKNKQFGTIPHGN